jgi:Fur family peroxide stress response transcriptional regulator
MSQGSKNALRSASAKPTARASVSSRALLLKEVGRAARPLSRQTASNQRAPNQRAPNQRAPNQRAADLMLAGVRASGLKLTPQRLAIVREIASDPTHPTAQELYERLLPSMPTMSFATVYNTLDALAAAGLCSARALSPGPSRFDPNMVAHDHAVCDSCGLVRDVTAQHEGAQHEGAQHAGAQHAGSQHAGRIEPAPIPGFSVHAVEQIYRGVCADCEKNRSGSRRKSVPQARRAGGASAAASTPHRKTANA